MKIAVDICNTIANINGEIEKHFNLPRIQGIYEHPCVTPNFFEEHNEIYENADAFNEARKVLQLLNGIVDIVYITARNESSRKITEHWLEINDFPKKKIVFTQDKPQAFWNEKCDIAIEDSPYEIDRYNKEGIDCFVVKWDYNTSYLNRGSFTDFYNYVIQKLETNQKE